MGRVAALFLLAVGIVLGFVGLIGTIVAIVELPAPRAVPLLFGFLVVDVVGMSCLIAGFVLLRKTKPIGQTTATAAEGTGDYPPGKEVSRELDGSPYTILYMPPVKGKHARPSSLTVSTPVATVGEFRIVRETGFDRLCKKLGVAVEVETGDEEFDRECYVRSDTPAFAAAYLNDPVKRVAILDMRRLGFPEVTLDDGDMSVTWVGFDPGKHHRPELTEDVAARLILLARNLPPHQPEFEHRTGAHRKQWQVVFWVFLALFAATIFSLIAYPPIRGSDLIARGAVLVAIGAPVFAYLSAVLLRGTSTSHYAWGALMIGTLFLFPIGSCGTVALLNGIQDDSPEVTHDAKIVEKYTTKSKNSTNYHVRCESWREPGETESFGVSFADYNAVVEHRSKLVVVSRAGSLGVEWLVSKRVDAQGR